MEVVSSVSHARPRKKRKAGPPARNNGNVTQISNTLNSARSQTFTYDTLNRVATAASGTWGEAYSLDAWGNLNQFLPYNNLSLRDKSASQQADASNRIIGFCYDTAGNLLDQGGCANPHAYTYNAENQLTYAGLTNYVYDGEGKRVEKYMLNTQGQITFQELYWYGGGSAPLEETDGTGNLTNSAFHEYVFFGGARIARRDGSSSGDVQYYIADQLGSARVVTNATGGTLSDIDYCPYGAQCYAASDTSGNNYKFTGKERDTESGLDNFGARYDASSMGRFMSPDPIFISKHRIVDPQQWDLYAYVRNNPLNLTDPTGKDLWERGCGNETATCHDDYVGSWDKKHKKFTPTTIQSDQNGNFSGHNVTMTTNGITVDGTYQGVFASGTSPTVVNGTGNLLGFRGTFSSNCVGHCEAEGTLRALPGHSISELLPILRGPNEKGDMLSGHEGDQYRGGNTYGPDIHVSYLPNRDSQSVHFDWRFPFGSNSGLAEHSADFAAGLMDKMTGQKSDPPYDQVGPSLDGAEVMDYPITTN